MNIIDAMWRRKIDVDGFSNVRVLEAIWACNGARRIIVHPLILERMRKGNLVDFLVSDAGSAVATFLGLVVTVDEKLRGRRGWRVERGL